MIKHTHKVNKCMNNILLRTTVAGSAMISETSTEKMKIKEENTALRVNLRALIFPFICHVLFHSESQPQAFSNDMRLSTNTKVIQYTSSTDGSVDFQKEDV